MSSPSESLDAYVKRVVDSFPPLTPERRDELARILRGTPAELDDAAKRPVPTVGVA